MNTVIKTLLLTFFGFSSSLCTGQDTIKSVPRINYQFLDIYPWSENSHAGKMTPHHKNSEGLDEIIFLNADMHFRISLYNDIVERLQSTDTNLGQALYLDFNPQVRIFTENSKPVKTPSFKAWLGYQNFYKIQENTKDNGDQKLSYVGLEYETGHYSNGQSGCSWDESLSDGSQECKDIYANINDNTNLSDILNRTNGNFSTNLTSISIGFKQFLLDDQTIGFPKSMLSAKIGMTVYHKPLLYFIDEGGYSDEDIGIYGKYRLSSNIQRVKLYSISRKKPNLHLRIKTELNAQLILDAHPHVNPIRISPKISAYPGYSRLGVTFGMHFGHDNYNYRFVDAGSNFFIGIAFDPFPPSISSSKILS